MFKTKKPYEITSFNIGFGAYTADFGFFITPNIKVEKAYVEDTGFAYSDHNPVRMKFRLK